MIAPLKLIFDLTCNPDYVVDWWRSIWMACNSRTNSSGVRLPTDLWERSRSPNSKPDRRATASAAQTAASP